MTDLPRITSPEAAHRQPHAMTNDDGDMFYPDSADDAEWFVREHGARPVDPGRFPFKEPTR